MFVDQIHDFSNLLENLREVEEFAISSKKPTKSREKILRLLKDHPNYSARKLAEVIGITPKAIEKHLAKLKSEDVIKREGPDKGGYWTVL